MIELFNDPKFLPISLELPELHEEFTDKCILDFERMPGLITAEEVKIRLADLRAKLVVVSLLCISGVCTICLGYILG